MRTTFLILLCNLLFVLTAFQCEDKPLENLDCEAQQKQLNLFKSEIKEMANEAKCDESSECRYVAFGSKPCGGPWEYIIYSSSIDTVVFLNNIKKYNALETTYNQTCGAFSDCAITQPPIGFECQNYKCIPIY